MLRLFTAVFLGTLLTSSVFASKAQEQRSPRQFPRLFNQRLVSSSQQTIIVDGLSRTYKLHLPAQYNPARPTALIVALHGGGGDAQGMESLSGLSELADREGFIVVYPEGMNNHWNDRRDPRFVADGSVNDVAFIGALLDQLQQTYAIDRQRIFATGISNGGFFSQVLACDLSQRIAAVAVVASNVPEALAQDCNLSRPISVMYFLGTDDPLVPYNGGTVTGEDGRTGVVQSAQDSFNFWVNRNQIRRTPQNMQLPDREVSDGTTVELLTVQNRQSEVTLYTITGGGHTWPDGLQYLPVALIGTTSREISASETMWQFFQEHPLP